jgi:hypothetical protein
MTEGELDKLVGKVLDAWADVEDRNGHEFGLSPNAKMALASIAVHAAQPECGARHLRRRSIMCTGPARHSPAGQHRNDELGLTWTDDWTEHDQLDGIILIPNTDDGVPRPGWACPQCTKHDGVGPTLMQDPDGFTRCPRCHSTWGARNDTDVSPAPSPDGEQPSQSVRAALVRATSALVAVDRKYRSDSKAINAPLVRKCRDALELCESVGAEQGWWEDVRA